MLVPAARPHLNIHRRAIQKLIDDGKGISGILQSFRAKIVTYVSAKVFNASGPDDYPLYKKLGVGADCSVFEADDHMKAIIADITACIQWLYRINVIWPAPTIYAMPEDIPLSIVSTVRGYAEVDETAVIQLMRNKIQVPISYEHNKCVIKIPSIDSATIVMRTLVANIKSSRCAAWSPTILYGAYILFSIALFFALKSPRPWNILLCACTAAFILYIRANGHDCSTHTNPEDFIDFAFKQAFPTSVSFEHHIGYYKIKPSKASTEEKEIISTVRMFRRLATNSVHSPIVMPYNPLIADSVTCTAGNIIRRIKSINFEDKSKSADDKEQVLAMLEDHIRSHDIAGNGQFKDFIEECATRLSAVFTAYCDEKQFPIVPPGTYGTAAANFVHLKLLRVFVKHQRTKIVKLVENLIKHYLTEQILQDVAPDAKFPEGVRSYLNSKLPSYDHYGLLTDTDQTQLKADLESKIIALIKLGKEESARGDLANAGVGAKK